jgi:hypothetical protein
MFYIRVHRQWKCQDNTSKNTRKCGVKNGCEAEATATSSVEGE